MKGKKIVQKLVDNFLPTEVKKKIKCNRRGLVSEKPEECECAPNSLSYYNKKLECQYQPKGKKGTLIGAGRSMKKKKTVRGGRMKVMKMVEPSSCLVGTQRYNGTMVDMALPAARPLISLGNAQYGDLFIR